MGKYQDVGIREYIHGDFDGDRIPNIDDKYPFRRSREWVNKEISLSKSLKHLDRERSKAKKIAYKFNVENNFDDFRVKDSYSTIDKLIRKKLNTMGDFIGFRSESDKRVEARQKWNNFNQKNKDKVYEKEDKYRLNRKTGNPYRAFHSNFNLKGFNSEVQFRTKKMGYNNDAVHNAYKNQKSMKKYLKKARELEQRGY